MGQISIFNIALRRPRVWSRRKWRDHYVSVYPMVVTTYLNFAEEIEDVIEDLEKTLGEVNAKSVGETQPGFSSVGCRRTLATRAS